MNTKITKSTRVAKNTILLYIRMMVVMLINLYTVRLVLNALGVEDYGVYNVIAGVIIMLQSVSSVLSTATQRFYSYSIGENRPEYLKNIFSASINIYVLFSFLVIVLGETIGLWFVNTQLVIPTERMIAANYVYQFSIFSFVCTIIQVPYSAVTIAHEDMGIFAVISTLEAVLKLMFAWLLFIIPFDKLIFYGAFLFLIPVLSLILYMVIGHGKYAECHYQKKIERSLYKKMLSFSGWTLFSSLAGTGINQVNTILVNIFFGPVVNAARAIALQINSAMSSFCASFLTAIKPPMIKSYAEGDHVYLNKIFYLSNKFVYYCLLLVCLPLLFEMDTVLELWLKIVDVQTVLFSRLILIYALIMSLNNPISIIIQATGYVKEYSVFVEFFTLLSVPVTYILFKLGYPAYTTFVVMVIVAFAAHIVRLIYLKKYYNLFSYSEYIKLFILPAILITFVVFLLVGVVHFAISNALLRLCLTVLISVVSTTLLTFLIGLSKNEKGMLKALIVGMKR
ncbi:oligosaccharide flippase family protein [Butyricimonas virosa]|uniref:oligosaccharide flippase family protein n=1 Tax=Butyricimonas virosa TaxID=544645 RepID=UPI00242E1B31|nr:oligosaccharide flippase family protein [Butyricimonas virosa]MDY5532547.1 oligosaccharide flippase family protein [Butyricimonas virosa]